MRCFGVKASLNDTFMLKFFNSFSFWLLLLLCAEVCASASLSAQENDTVYHRLSGVEVNAKRIPQTIRSTAPLQIINKSSMERLGIENLSEAVKHFSGVTVQDYGGIGGLKTVSVRSLGAKHTAVSYDGITINDASSGQVDISRFSLDNVESVSLTIGQSDDIFKTARMYASAGALSITTSKPEFKSGRPYHIYAKIKGGSFGLFNPIVRYEHQLGKRWSSSTTAEWESAKGAYPFKLVNGNLTTHEKRNNSDIQTLRLEENIYGDFGKGGLLSAKFYSYNSERGLPGSVIFYNTRAKERLWNDNFFTQIHYENQLSKLLKLQSSLKYDYSYTRYRDLSNIYPNGKQVDCNRQNEYYATAGLLYTPMQFLAFSLNSDLSRNTLHNNYTNAEQPKRWTSLTAFAAQYKITSFTFTGSLLATYVTDKVQQGDKPSDKKRLSPALSLSWRPFIEEALRVRLSYKDIFRIPTFTDLYYLRMGNRSLRPEKTKQYDLGLTWNGQIGNAVRDLNITVDGYYNKVTDKIVALPTLYIWRMMNMGKVDIKGLDVNVSGEIPFADKMSFLVAGAYTFQKAIDLSDPTSNNYRDQIPYTPKHSGSASLSWQNPWVNITYRLTAAGDRYALPENIESNKIDSYVEHSLSCNRNFNLKHCTLRVQGEAINLTGKNYEIIQYYPMPGRSWRVSVSINY
jgi:outer membrane cobalamin receptor